MTGVPVPSVKRKAGRRKYHKIWHEDGKILFKDMNYMAKHWEDMNEERKSCRSKADFFRWAGIESELAEFVTQFIEKPELFFSMPFERRREIEKQMDAVLFSFKQ